MKTAISVPDQTFDRAERVARKHGMNRSQFYSAAAERYASELESEDLTAAINAAVDEANTDGSARFAAAAGVRLLEEADEQW
ncbi:CopG family transcriptional regulator [Sinomonas sp. ASV322]|uniref:CopG family transcriptional regulator n=1 Tax=Sinomonas sp. ASV322 TaxID=3041920 RepID=UPI0027DC37F1|nr:CopG family transcriptional regulator [Sinomonas sp. ASV322]MDQ4502221.1 CopG family transcriptional regulator [Sinomonas sp. ASV322]